MVQREVLAHPIQNVSERVLIMALLDEMLPPWRLYSEPKASKCGFATIPSNVRAR